MALSAIGIANLALSHLGTSTTIESFIEKTTEAREATRWYDQCRQEVLEAHDWSFARKRQTLALHGDAAPDQWSFRYQYPTGCLKMRRIWNPLGEDADHIPYELELQLDSEIPSILTDMEEAVGVFTLDQTRTTTFTPLFYTALSHLIASRMAMTLTGKSKIRDDNSIAFQRYINWAGSADANEEKKAPPREAEWIRERE